jgi:hypothetical protein
MNDWNEGEHAPNIRKEVEKAWSKLSKAAKQKNAKSEWISKNVGARKLVCMEDGGAPQEQIARESVGAGGQEKQERAQKKRAEMQKERKEPEEPAAEATTDTVRKTQVWLLGFEIVRVRSMRMSA